LTPNQQILVLASALLLASVETASASSVTETTTTAVDAIGSPTVPLNTTFSFPTIMGADELVSIGGTPNVFFPEGATFSIFVDYVGGAQQQIDTITIDLTKDSPTLQLNTLANLAFTAGDIDGITFKAASIAGPELKIPVGTTFVFDVPASVAPEPASWTLLVAGFAGLGAAMKRRRKKATLA
jgi:hypothetical protein